MFLPNFAEISTGCDTRRLEKHQSWDKALELAASRSQWRQFVWPNVSMTLVEQPIAMVQCHIPASRVPVSCAGQLVVVVAAPAVRRRCYRCCGCSCCPYVFPVSRSPAFAFYDRLLSR